MFILDDRQIVSSRIDGDRLYSAVCEQFRHPLLDGLLESASDPFVYLAQLGQAKHVQLMPHESLDDVLLQVLLLPWPFFTSNLFQLNSHVVEAHCQLRRVVWQLSEGGLFSTTSTG